MADRTVNFKGNAKKLLGNEVKAGDKAPDFACANAGLEIISLEKTGNKARLFSVVPSLDTPVCNKQTHKFDEELAGLKDKAACYTVSLDLPFAQKRFCDAESINKSDMQTLSDVHNGSFGKAYGVLLDGLPIPLLARAIFVVDKDNKVVYAEYTGEVTDEPNYDKAIEALKKAAG